MRSGPSRLQLGEQFTIRILIVTIAFLVATNGCTNAGAPTNPDLGLGPPAGAALLEDSSMFSSGDIAWARLALEVPGGFAGIYINDDRRPVLRLTQPEKKQAAMAILSTRQVAYLPSGINLSDAIVERAKWDFAQLYDWSRYVTPRIGTGVIMLDIDEVHNRITMGVLERDRARIAADLTKLSLPTGLVSVQAQTPVCYSDMVPAVRVWAEDLQTRESITSGARLTIRNAGFTETTVGSPNFPQAPLEAGIGKTGVFDVMVQQTGYNDWEQKNVLVKFDGCFPITVELTVVLRRP